MQTSQLSESKTKVSVKATNKEVGTDISVPGQGAWGAENTSNRDVIIPRLNLMQDLSKAVKAGSAKVGDIFNTATGQVVGGPDKPLEFIPIYSYNDWVISEGLPGGKKKYIGTIKMTAENEGWPYEEVVAGKQMFRQRRLNFFAVLPGEFIDLPVLISFKGMSTKTGRKLMTYFQKCQMANRPPATQTWKLSTLEESRDTNTFYVFDLAPGTRTTKADLDNAYRWYQEVSKADVKVADDNEEVVDANSEDVPF